MIIGINALYLLPGKVGGSETYLRNLIKSLAVLDRENIYVVFINRESEGAIEAPAPNFRVIVCPFHAANRPLRILWEQGVLPWQVKRHKIDVLLSAGMTAPVLCPAMSALMLFDLQHINQPGNFAWYHLLFLRSIIYASARSADGVLTISHQVRNDIIRFYHLPPGRIEVTHLAVDHDAFSLPHKNHERLFQALCRIREQVPEMKLVLIGARDKGVDELMRIIDVLGLEQAVLLLGWLPFEDVPSIYRASEAFVFPTLHEGFGLPVIEAMACGVPVVCSRIEPLLEVAGDAALFVDPLSSGEIAAAVIKVVTDRPSRLRLVNAGLARSRAFTWEATARKTLDFLKQITAQRAQ
jgi:glycosyltransferase involved in cell wall biosynthesis